MASNLKGRAAKRLEARVKAYEDSVRTSKGSGGSGFHKPGSLSGKK